MPQRGRNAGWLYREGPGGLERVGLRGEVLVANNGSADESAAIAGKAGARVIIVKEKGYGSALRAGIEAARGK